MTGDHVSVMFDDGFVHTATTKTVVVRHRKTFGTTTIAKKVTKRK